MLSSISRTPPKKIGTGLSRTLIRENRARTTYAILHFITIKGFAKSLCNDDEIRVGNHLFSSKMPD